MSIHFSTDSDKIVSWQFRQEPLLTSPYEKKSLKIHDSIIMSSSSEELLGVLIDSELIFHDHITRLCSNQKLSALARVSNYITFQKRRLLMSSYITSQFNYCPLVWMIYNRILKKKIKKVHERAWRIVYGDHKTKFSELLNIDKSVTIHQKTCNIYLLKSIKLKKGYLANNNEWNFSIFWKYCLWT